MELNAIAADNNTLADDDDGFTFAEVDPPLAVAGGGRYVGRPMYPVFGRPRSPPPPTRWPRPEPETRTTDASRLPLWRFLMVDQGPPPTQTPADDLDLDLDGEPAESTYVYCPLCPALPVAAAAAAASPARCRKSSSTGSYLLRWRQRPIRRSHSEGKERFVFLNAASSSGSEPKGRGSSESTGHDDALCYYATGGRRGGGSGGRRKSFLPYKQDLVGIFANATVFRRSYHPF